jgi:phospholipase/carboxylesterase
MARLSGPRWGPSASGPPDSLVVLLHGVGADGADLIGLAPTLARHLPRARFIAPDAPDPCDLAPYGRQWFSLQDRRSAALSAGVGHAASALDTFLDELLAAHGLPAQRLALLGFSQGTMLALHVAPRRTSVLAAVVGYSGALVGAEELARDRRSSPPVLLVHGDADEVVPVQALPAAVVGLQAASVPVRWIVRPGLPHAIDPEGIDAGACFLTAALTTKPEIRSG